MMKCPQVSQHSVYLFYPFYFESTTQSTVRNNVLEKIEALKISDVIDALYLPDKLKERLSEKKLKDKKVWEKTTVKLSTDLHEHLRRILTSETEGAQDQESTYFSGYTPFKLTTEFENLLTGDWGKFGKGLKIKLAKSAMKRLNIDNQHVPVWLRGIDIYFFGMGVGILLVHISYIAPGKEKPSQQPTPELIIESNYAISRTGKQACQLQWVEQNETKDFILEEIIESLVPMLKPETTDNKYLKVKKDWNRLFMYTVVQFAGRFTDSRDRVELAYRLGKKYTEDYLPLEELMDNGIITPFENIIHGVNLEGGVVLVEQVGKTGNEIEFLKTFANDKVKMVYLPLALIAFQEYLTLLKMTQGIFLPIDFHNPTENARRILENQQDELLDFRLNYRFSHASKITMHNLVYEKWREVLSLDKMQEEITQDVKEVEAFLNYKQEKLHSRRWEKVSRIQTILGIFFGTLVFLTGFFGMNFNELNNIDWNSKITIIVSAVSIFIGITMAVIYTVFAVKFRIDKGEKRKAGE